MCNDHCTLSPYVYPRDYYVCMHDYISGDVRLRWQLSNCGRKLFSGACRARSLVKIYLVVRGVSRRILHIDWVFANISTKLAVRLRSAEQ